MRSPLDSLPGSLSFGAIFAIFLAILLGIAMTVGMFLQDVHARAPGAEATVPEVEEPVSTSVSPSRPPPSAREKGLPRPAPRSAASLPSAASGLPEAPAARPATQPSIATPDASQEGL